MIRFAEAVALKGLIASIGSIGDARDNAAAETVMSLYNNEAVAKNSPFTTGPLGFFANVELTFGWVERYNNRHRHGRLGRIPPKGYERRYYAKTTGSLEDQPGDMLTACNWVRVR